MLLSTPPISALPLCGTTMDLAMSRPGCMASNSVLLYPHIHPRTTVLQVGTSVPPLLPGLRWTGRVAQSVPLPWIIPTGNRTVPGECRLWLVAVPTDAHTVRSAASPARVSRLSVFGGGQSLPDDAGRGAELTLGPANAVPSAQPSGHALEQPRNTIPTE